MSNQFVDDDEATTSMETEDDEEKTPPPSPSQSSSSSSSDSEFVLSQNSQRDRDEALDDAMSPTEDVARAFMASFQAWLKSNYKRVDAAYDSHSGWEVWLHVELYLFIKKQNANADILREPNSYPGKGRLRGDFLLNGNGGDDPNAGRVTVEIKTESYRQNATQFRNNIDRDLGKVEGLGKDGALVIGVTITKGATKALTPLVDSTINIQGVVLGWTFSTG